MQATFELNKHTNHLCRDLTLSALLAPLQGPAASCSCVRTHTPNQTHTPQGPDAVSAAGAAAGPGHRRERGPRQADLTHHSGQRRLGPQPKPAGATPLRRGVSCRPIHSLGCRRASGAAECGAARCSRQGSTPHRCHAHTKPPPTPPGFFLIPPLLLHCSLRTVNLLPAPTPLFAQPPRQKAGSRRFCSTPPLSAALARYKMGSDPVNPP